MNINRYALCKERSLQKIISKQPKPNTTAIGVCSETQVTHHIITKRSDECLPISAYVPKHKEGDGKKFPVIIDIYGGDFVAGRSALNRNFGAWCAEHGYLTFIPEYTQVPETNLFGQLGDLLKAFVVIHRCAERYGADMSRMYLVGDGAGAALACLVYALLWNPVSMQHLEDELPFDVPQEAKLSFKAVCLQNGILDLSSRKMNAIAPYLIEKDWKKTSYAECLSPKTYAKMLPPCLLVTSITDAHKRDTNQLAWQLKLKGTRYSVHSANNLFTKESFRTMTLPTKETVEMLRSGYPNGTRVRLVKMNDLQAPPVGTEGTVVGVDGIGSLIMLWDNGSGLNVLYGVDEVEKI